MKANQEVNNQKKRAVYEKPSIEVIEMELDGVICQSSSGSGDFNPGGGGGLG